MGVHIQEKRACFVCGHAGIEVDRGETMVATGAMGVEVKIKGGRLAQLVE